MTSLPQYPKDDHCWLVLCIMALDLQRNWDVSMAKNLDKVKRARGGSGTLHNSKKKNSTMDEKPIVWKTPPVYLPDEIIVQILDYVARFHESQETLASCCILSRQWYAAAAPFLYASPFLYGSNFDPFYRAICPSINPHIRKSALTGLVKVLDMRSLVHQSSKKTTARLLGRTKHNLEAFVAPMSGFGENCFAALSKADHLRLLDLSLISESPPLLLLLNHVSHLQHLTTFRLPRSSGFTTEIDPTTVIWPPNLEDLTLSGGIDAHFLYGIVSFPRTLRSLTIERCTMAKGYAVNHMLRAAVRPLPNLEHLKLAHLPRLSGSSLDAVLYLLPGLTKLSVSVDYITPAVFDFDVGSHREAMDLDVCDEPTPTRHGRKAGTVCQLRTLELTNSGNPGLEDKITPIDILIAIDEDALPHLRHVRVAKSLLWQASAEAGDVDALVDALQESAIKHGEKEGKSTGVWTMDDN